MSRAKGFSLVEVVIAIILLALLAVIAAPKFINLQTDAHAAKLQAMQAAINTANLMVYAKAVTQGKSHTPEDSITLTSNGYLDTTFGYIKATQAALETAINIKFDKISTVNGTSEWVVEEKQAGVGFVTSIEIWMRNTPVKRTQDPAIIACKLIYTQANVLNRAPSIILQTDDC